MGLWTKNEYNALKLSNPDGYFYLLYLKYCAYFFTALSIISTCVTIPLYSVVHKPQPFPGVLNSWNLSKLDTITLVMALDDPEIVNLTIYLGVLYSILAYFFLSAFCVKMSKFEFQPTIDHENEYASKHAVCIRGINKEIGTKTVEHKIKKIFDKVTNKKVVGVYCYRKNKEPHKKYRKVKAYKEKVRELRKQQNLPPDSFDDKLEVEGELIWVGSRAKCNRR